MQVRKLSPKLTFIGCKRLNAGVTHTNNIDAHWKGTMRNLTTDCTMLSGRKQGLLKRWSSTANRELSKVGNAKSDDKGANLRH